MRLFRRRATAEPDTAPIPVLSGSAVWRETHEHPAVGSLIEFEWHGVLFTGRFQGATQPWGVSWMIFLRYFGGPSTTRYIEPKHIARWRYK